MKKPFTPGTADIIHPHQEPRPRGERETGETTPPPLLFGAVEPGLNLESITCYIGDRFEKTSSDLQTWRDSKYIFATGRRIEKIDPDGVHYFHKDHLGSTTVVTDETGDNVLERAMHMPYGAMWSYNLSNGAPSRYKFTDQELDLSTGLYDYGARLYDPALGRFISPDSILPDVYDPQSLNRYAYARNNPLKYIDPSGNAHLEYGLDDDDVVATEALVDLELEIQDHMEE